jgi:hypothetical protein
LIFWTHVEYFQVEIQRFSSYDFSCHFDPQPQAQVSTCSTPTHNPHVSRAEHPTLESAPDNPPPPRDDAASRAGPCPHW